MYLPEDLMLGVLPRLPPKSLSRFRSVCKAWQAMIDSPPFMNQYLMLTHAYDVSGNESLHLICQECIFGPTNMTFLFSDKQIINLNCLPDISDLYEDTERWFHPSICGPINGIYCISITPSQTSRCVNMFWNPGNGQVHVLPPIPDPVITDHLADLYNEMERDPLAMLYGGFEFDPLSEDYKFFSIEQYGYPFLSPLHHFVCFHLYSLASNSWQQLDPVQLAHPDLINIYDDGRATFVPELMTPILALPFNRSCHWVDDRVVGRDESGMIVITYLLSFDIVNRVFRVSTIPKTALGESFLSLTTVDGCLAAVSLEDVLNSIDKVAAVIHVGVMKEYGIEESWIKAYRVVLNAPGTFLGIVDDQLFVQETDGWMVLYALGSHQEDYNECCYVPFQHFTILPFKGSLIPICPSTHAQ
uniref:F-box domain-containing protein n=1 Tax=Opuntia streptacantha TaxID=393608 RepID=A0A7C9B0C5_OPUST